MKPLLPIFLLLFTTAHSLCAQTFKLTGTVFNVGDVYIVDKVYFDFYKWTIRNESILQLDSIVDSLTEHGTGQA